MWRVLSEREAGAGGIVVSREAWKAKPRGDERRAAHEVRAG
jgi:hypothetical protein